MYVQYMCVCRWRSLGYSIVSRVVTLHECHYQLFTLYIYVVGKLLCRYLGIMVCYFCISEII